MIGRLYHLSRRDAKRRAYELLVQFDLTDAAGRIAKTYSGGMRRRLDLAASLVLLPPLLFLDEPTTGLDPLSRRAIWDEVRALNDAGTTVFLTTQYLEDADVLADRPAHVVGLVHDVVAGHGRRATGWAQQRGEHADGRRLPGAIRAQERIDLTFRDVEVDTCDGNDAARESPCESAGLDSGHTSMLFGAVTLVAVA
jgi:ABC-type molybdate transport system ATPase subunit